MFSLHKIKSQEFNGLFPYLTPVTPSMFSGRFDMAFESLRWFKHKKKDKEDVRDPVLEELQGLKKLLRKQSVLIEEMHREQIALAAEKRDNQAPLLDLCDAIFYLHRAFQNPGLMSRQHAQVLNMVLNKAHRFAASLGLEMIMEEGVPFDPEIHEAVANRSPESNALSVLELIQPGYVKAGNVLRPAKVIVGASSDLAITGEGTVQ
jgi:molecular chaperone GrpE (heat shock protein)